MEYNGEPWLDMVILYKWASDMYNMPSLYILVVDFFKYTKQALQNFDSHNG